MNVRKIALYIACILSGVSAFLPFYFVQVDGKTVEDGALSIMPSFYGIGIVVTAVLTIGFALFGMSKGYIITSLINAGCSFYSCYQAYVGKETAMYSLRMADKFQSAFTGVQTESLNFEIVTGPGFVLLILAAVLVLLMMFWNVMNPNED